MEWGGGREWVWRLGGISGGVGDEVVGVEWEDRAYERTSLGGPCWE